tara:strand:+ start:337 stop:969 length:633 start_codon:yes stop_codon:yes gene_type:complete
MELIKFSQISDVSILDSSGVYAWYYKVSLGNKDIEDLLETLQSKSRLEKEELVKRFLNRHFYQYFKESNYLASIKGKLMPQFEGELIHVDQSSKSLISNIVDNPKSLWQIKDFISKLSVDLSSPIYIGMADSLRSRLNHHKNLIEKFKSEHFISDSTEDRDHNFAARVVSRKMLVKNLSVSIHYVESDIKLHNLLENLINRISYPVLGRN